MKFKTIEWKNNSIVILDQRKLPSVEQYIEIKTVKKLAHSIKTLAIRGAPALGVAGAYGVALSSYINKNLPIKKARAKILADIKLLKKTRPTAVNLFWALEKMKMLVLNYKNHSASPLHSALLKEAKKIHNQDKELCRKIGEFGSKIIPQKANIMTHCNAGALATGGLGTALSVIYTAKRMGKHLHVYVGETRPLLQGARLTSWELKKNNIPVTLLVDSARASIIKKGIIDVIIVGADRIAANGDTANKIGTYPLAVLAKIHKVNFYIAAPSTTFDLSVKSGEEIPIEQRSAVEVSSFSKVKTAPYSVDVYNPAFDVTPNKFITGIITEKGIIRKPFTKNIKKFVAR